MENKTLSALDNARKTIFENLKKCDFHIQGCLQLEDGCHLKLDGTMITMWARSLVRNFFLNLLIYLFLKSILIINYLLGRTNARSK